MSIKLFNFLIIFGTIVAGAAFYSVFTGFDPALAGLGVFIIFYSSAAIALSGIFLLVSELIKRRLVVHQPSINRLGQSIRHAIFFSLLMVGWALLKSQGLLRWWNVLLLIAVLTVLEFFFISFKRHAPVLHEG